MKKYITIYSLNQLAYLMLLGYCPTLTSDNNRLWYGILDYTPDVQKAIEDWRNENLVVPIHQYLNSYKELRENINEKRGGRNG